MGEGHPGLKHHLAKHSIPPTPIVDFVRVNSVEGNQRVTGGGEVRDLRALFGADGRGARQEIADCLRLFWPILCLPICLAPNPCPGNRIGASTGF